MKKEFKPLSWNVKCFDCNRQVIEDYDVLKYREKDIRKFKKECATKEEFTEKLRREFMWQYCSRCEYELIIEITEDNHVLLKPWTGCRDKKAATIDVTNDQTFNWKGFAEHHIEKQIYKNEAKIDCYDQIMWSWPSIADYCWYTRLKYQRDNPKFYKQGE